MESIETAIEKPPPPTSTTPTTEIIEIPNSIRIAKTKQRHRAASLVFFEKNKANEIARRNTHTE